MNGGRWTSEERALFATAFQRHGRNWVKVSNVVKTRNPIQVRSHAQKYLQRPEFDKDGLHSAQGDKTRENKLSFDQRPTKMTKIERLRKTIPVLEDILHLAQQAPPQQAVRVEGFRTLFPIEQSTALVGRSTAKAEFGESNGQSGGDCVEGTRQESSSCKCRGSRHDGAKSPAARKDGAGGGDTTITLPPPIVTPLPLHNPRSRSLEVTYSRISVDDAALGFRAFSGMSPTQGERNSKSQRRDPKGSGMIIWNKELCQSQVPLSSTTMATKHNDGTKVVSAPASPNNSAHSMSVSRASTPDLEARPKSILRRSEKKNDFPKRVSFKLLSGRHELLKPKDLMSPIPIWDTVLTSRPEQTVIHHQGALAHRTVATAETLLSMGENKRSRKFIVPRIQWPIGNEAAR